MAPLLIPALLALGGTWLLLSRSKKPSEPVADTSNFLVGEEVGSYPHGVIVEYGMAVSDDDVTYFRERLSQDAAANPGVTFQLIASPEPGITVIVVVDGESTLLLLDDPLEFDEAYESALGSVLRGELL